MSQLITGTSGTSEEERNRKAVLEFYETVIKGGEYDRVLEWVDPGYIQHKPVISDGPGGVLDFVRNEHKRVPGHVVKIVRCLRRGLCHSSCSCSPPPTEADRAVMDIFRCKNGKLLEHWDVMNLYAQSLTMPMECFEEYAGP